MANTVSSPPVKVMRCAYCNDDRAWPDGYPSTSYARCWPCYWKNHVDEEHPPKRTRLRSSLRAFWQAWNSGVWT